jgi:tetratricopeptide (TPR) repeat protein
VEPAPLLAPSASDVATRAAAEPPPLLAAPAPAAKHASPLIATVQGAPLPPVGSGVLLIPSVHQAKPAAPDPATAGATPSGAAESARAAAATLPPTSVASADAHKPSSAQLRKAHAQAQRGDRMLRRGAEARARMLYDEALRTDPNLPRALAGRAKVALRGRDTERALQHAQRLVSLRPRSASALLLLGDVQRQAGDLVSARNAWRQAARLGAPAARTRLRSPP